MQIHPFFKTRLFSWGWRSVLWCCLVAYCIWWQFPDFWFVIIGLVIGAVGFVQGVGAIEDRVRARKREANQE
jgi:hypothetical protein